MTGDICEKLFATIEKESSAADPEPSPAVAGKTDTATPNNNQTSKVEAAVEETNEEVSLVQAAETAVVADSTVAEPPFAIPKVAPEVETVSKKPAISEPAVAASPATSVVLVMEPEPKIDDADVIINMQSLESCTSVQVCVNDECIPLEKFCTPEGQCMPLESIATLCGPDQNCVLLSNLCM